MNTLLDSLDDEVEDVDSEEKSGILQLRFNPDLKEVSEDFLKSIKKDFYSALDFLRNIADVLTKLNSFKPEQEIFATFESFNSEETTSLRDYLNYDCGFPVDFWIQVCFYSKSSPKLKTSIFGVKTKDDFPELMPDIFAVSLQDSSFRRMRVLDKEGLLSSLAEYFGIKI